LQKQNIEYKKVHIWGNSHAGYYPNSFPLTIKLLFADDGKIFGAQAVGMEGVEKRIDVISSIMRMDGKIQDLVDSELSYAPPYSSAKDPVNIIGMAADNILKGFVKPAFYEDLNDSYLIDVRSPMQFSTKTIEGAINIPAENLRDRLNEIPKDKKVVLFCNKGFTSYISSRILLQNGFDNVFSLSGGHLLYKEIIKNKEGFLMNNSPKPQIINNTEFKTLRVDACGMQCPGPIMKLSETIKSMNTGEVLELSTTDPGFKSDVTAWCDSTGNSLLGLTTENKIIKAKIQKGTSANFSQKETGNGQTIVIFSNDLDKALASFIIANGALAAGKEVTMFFTFWGLNILRKPNGKPVKKGLIDKMFGMMMPKGAGQLILSKMHMGGMGTAMMKWVMKNKNVATLQELIEDAQANGAKLIACNMSMDVMGIKKEELIDGVEIAGVAKYINESSKSNSNLFI
jgi:peroxiredoxin family protein/TusA-related sulfurtransferase/rhodanese-related sulfurtransferase